MNGVSFEVKTCILISLVMAIILCFPAWVPTQSLNQIPLQGHVASVNAVQYNPKGGTVAGASDDQTVKIFQTSDGVLLRTLGHFDDVNDVEYSPDGTKIVTASADNFARVWDAQTGKQLRLYDHLGDVNSAAFSPNGKFIITGGDDNVARLWDFDTNQLLAILPHEDDVNAVDFAPDGKSVVTGSSDGSAYIWDITNFILPPATVTPTPTPMVTPTAAPTVEPPQPVIVFPFDSSTEYGREPGGFGGAASGSTTVGAIPFTDNGLSDGFGVTLTTSNGEVELITLPSINVSGGLIVVRASVQSTGPGAAMSLAIADESLDGSLLVNTQTNSSRYIGEYRQIVAIYRSDSAKVFPIFQVANTGSTFPVAVFLDQLEVYVLPKDGVIPNEFLFGQI